MSRSQQSRSRDVTWTLYASLLQKGVTEQFVCYNFEKHINMVVIGLT